MGFGEQIYYSIAIEMGHHANVLAFALAVISFVLYMLDADEWVSRAGSIFLDVCILAIVCGSVLLVLMIADRFPTTTIITITKVPEQCQLHLHPPHPLALAATITAIPTTLTLP